MDFEDISAETAVERRRNEERQKRLDVFYKNKAQRAEKELEGKFVHGSNSLTWKQNSCLACMLMAGFGVSY